MKNIHILPTDKPSRLHFDGKLFLSPNYQDSKTINSIVEGRNIYVTCDVEIKEGEKCITFGSDKCKGQLDTFQSNVMYSRKPHKIILTTDQALIKDGVQAIDDEFLEWFVKNPSCEYVKITKDKIRQDKEFNDISHWNIYEYKISIPKEEPKFISGQFFLERADEVIVIHRPKQETLEEVAERLLRDHRDFEVEGDSSYQNGRLNGILEGLKYQSERMYSEEDVRDAFALGMDYYAEPNDWDKVTPKQKLENLLIKKQ